MKVFYLDIEDLSGVYSSFEKAKAFIMEEAKALDWRLYDVHTIDKNECEIFYFKTPNGNILPASIVSYVIDEKPYI